jgi:pyrimidine operon attenuation protein/uracil phosphoribosyltransferase
MQNLILDTAQIQKKITRIAYEIYEEHADEKEIVLAGAAPGGYMLAQKIEQALKKISPLKTTLLKVEIDKSKTVHTARIVSDKIIDLKNKAVVLVDDVLNTGKVLSYCTAAFLAHPVKSVKLAVLVDRNHTNFPVKSDYTGLSVSTTMQEHISVNLEEKGKESVVLKD